MNLSFKEWMQYNPADTLLGEAFDKISNKILSSMRVEDGQISFQFPQNYSIFFQSDQEEELPMRLVAHNDPLLESNEPEMTKEQFHASYGIHSTCGIDPNVWKPEPKKYLEITETGKSRFFRNCPIVVVRRKNYVPIQWNVWVGGISGHDVVVVTTDQNEAALFERGYDYYMAAKTKNKNEADLGKGGMAFKAIAQSQFAQQMNGRQAYEFQRGMKSNIKKIAKDMGLAFELELFLHMTEQKKLSPVGDKNQIWARTEVDKLYSKIRGQVGANLGANVQGFINHHSSELAESMYQKASQLIKAKVDQVTFAGGNPLGIAGTGHRVTADLILGSSKLRSGRRNIGFTTKFTSETNVRVADVWFNQMYAMLGGKNIVSFSNQLKEVPDEDQREWLLDQYEGLLNNIVKNRNKVNFIINKILFGTEDSDGPGSKETISDVMPAYRNYVRARGDADFSPALKKDFNVTNDSGMKLTLKPDSNVITHRTKVAVLLKIDNPEGSTGGTYIKFQVELDRVVIYMNNLTSQN